MGVGRHPLQHAILSCFCHAPVLRFAGIVKRTTERSNLVAYHLKRLVAQGIVLKDNDQYRLAPEAEFFLPYLNTREKLKLAVVLIAIVKQNKVVLIQRDQRPYQKLWSMPGGKIYFDESIEEAAVRIAKRETGATIEIDGACSIVDELVLSDKPKHGWLLFLVKAHAMTPVKQGRWVAIKDLDALRVIESDKWMIRTLLNRRVDINHVRMQEVPDGMSFSVLPVHS
jgi:ADP-ribose pyrophosphatase YjhB (NUDIX family)